MADRCMGLVGGGCSGSAEFRLQPVEDPGPMLRGLTVVVCGSCLPASIRMAPGPLIVEPIR